MEPRPVTGHVGVMEERSDLDLWAAAASGSDASFGVLFERHASSIYNYCFRRTGDWAAAEDLMSAVFLEAWRQRSEVQLTGDSLRPWLFGVATNLMRNDLRSRRRRDKALQRVRAQTPQMTEGHADEVASRLDDEQRMKEVLSSLASMNAAEQEVIALVVWSGLTYEEAAIALDVPVGTVRSRLSRARRRLLELTTASGHDIDERTALARASTPSMPREVEG